MGLQVHRVFSVAFKAAALRRVEAGEALATVARDLKVERKLLYDWRRAYETGGLAGLENRKPESVRLIVCGASVSDFRTGDHDADQARTSGRIAFRL